MVHTVSYPCRHPLVLHPKGKLGTSIVRPWIEVVVTIGASSHKAFCLVDTGADDTVLDLATAGTLGVNHLAPPQVSVTGVGSGTTLH